MEGRSLSTTALAAAGAAVLVALVVLVIKVRAAAPDPDVNPAELSRATSAGQVEQQSSPAREVTPRIPPPGEAGAPRAAGVRRRGSSLSWSRGEPAAESGAQASEAPAEAPPDAPSQSPPDAPAEAGRPASAEIATEYYDSGDYERARTAAVEALRLDLAPQAADKMLRIAASASCFMGEPEQARVHYEQLTPRSQRDIARRCRRMGIEF